MRISVEPLRQHREETIQISLRIQSVRLGGFQQGEDDDAGAGSRLGIAEQPVLPTHNNGPDRVLHLVVADFNLPMAEERAKILLLVEGVGYRLLQLACRLEDRLQPGVVFVDNGSGKKPASRPLPDGGRAGLHGQCADAPGRTCFAQGRLRQPSPPLHPSRLKA